MTIRNIVIASVTAMALAAGSGLALADDTSSGTAEQDNVASQAQGLYSANQLLGAPVYAQSDSHDEIGEVGDVLLGNNMKIRSFIITTKGKFDILNGKSYVVSPDQLAVKTRTTDHATRPDYRVKLDMTRDELSDKPVYSDSWWSNAQSQAREAWQKTKSNAASAWNKVKNKTSDIINDDKDKADQPGDDQAPDSSTTTDSQ